MLRGCLRGQQGVQTVKGIRSFSTATLRRCMLGGGSCVGGTRVPVALLRGCATMDPVLAAVVMEGWTHPSTQCCATRDLRPGVQEDHANAQAARPASSRTLLKAQHQHFGIGA